VVKPNPVVSTCTTDLVTVFDNCWTDSLKTWRGSLLSNLADSAERVGCSVWAAQNQGITVTLKTATARNRKPLGIDGALLTPGQGRRPWGTYNY
jgi:hypothetical protein